MELQNCLPSMKNGMSKDFVFYIMHYVIYET